MWTATTCLVELSTIHEFLFIVFQIVLWPTLPIQTRTSLLNENMLIIIEMPHKFRLQLVLYPHLIASVRMSLVVKLSANEYWHQNKVSLLELVLTYRNKLFKLQKHPYFVLSYYSHTSSIQEDHFILSGYPTQLFFRSIPALNSISLLSVLTFNLVHRFSSIFQPQKHSNQPWEWL